MKFFGLFMFVFALFAATSVAADFWSDLGHGLESAGQYTRDAIVKAGTAVDVIERAATIIRGNGSSQSSSGNN